MIISRPWSFHTSTNAISTVTPSPAINFSSAIRPIKTRLKLHLQFNTSFINRHRYTNSKVGLWILTFFSFTNKIAISLSKQHNFFSLSKQHNCLIISMISEIKYWRNYPWPYYMHSIYICRPTLQMKTFFEVCLI